MPRYYKELDANEGISRREKSSGRKTHHMMAHDGGRGALIREEMSNVCGLPMGALQRVASSEASMSYEKRGVNDMFSLVNQTLKEDSMGVRSLSKPRNF